MAEGGGDDDKDSKTEDPTEKRIEDARKKGQVINSREVGTALLFLAALFLFFFQGAGLWNALQGKMKFLLSGPIQDDFTQGGMAKFFEDLILSILGDLAPFFIVLVIAAFVGGLLQHGWLVSWEAVMPKFSKVSPIQGFKRLFSMRSIVEAIKSVFKMGLVGIVVWLALVDSFDEVLILAATSIPKFTQFMSDEFFTVWWRVTLIFVMIAVLDYAYQRYEFMKNLRMTKQEVKDEHKQTEGDPQIKARIKQAQREMAQRRMMAEVPKADVVITNPTHFSVALAYTPGEMEAPKVVAKGQGHVALRIRELAEEHDVPLVENPPLARTLHRDVDLDRPVPANLFKAVAEVLAYVYRIKGKKGQGSEAPSG